MRDYGLKLFESIHDTVKLQQLSLESLLFGGYQKKPSKNAILSDIEIDSYEKLPKKTIINIEKNSVKRLVLFNSLAQDHEHIVQVRVTSPNVKVTDEHGKDVLIQINPVWNASESNTRLTIVENEYELLFIATIPALTVATYNVTYFEHAKENMGDTKSFTPNLATIYCNKCHLKEFNENYDQNIVLEPPQYLPSKFKIRNTQMGDIQLENHKFKLLFDGRTGFIKSVTQKRNLKIIQCSIQFFAYKSAQYHSGAYLFMPDPNERDVERDVLLDYKDHMSIIITSGNVASELTVIYGAFLVHTIRIYHPETSSLSNGIYVENEVDFENPPKNRETELFMRVVTDIQNGDPPQFYTDLNGFQMQKRVKVEQIGIEGNYFPITTMAYIEDEKLRLSLITNHAQGAAAWQPGCLEVMLDRRTLYDDSRGMGEGVIDNRKTVNKYWLLFENYQTEEPKRFASHRIDKRQVEKAEFSRPSLFANHLSNSLNYPVGIFIVSDEFSKLKVEHSLKLINKEFPCDYHVLTFRTQVDPIYSQFPSNFALLVLHRQGYSCKINSNYTCKKFNIDHDTKFELLKVESIQPVTLTGLENEGDSITDLSEMTLSPMTLQSYNFTFDMYM